MPKKKKRSSKPKTRSCTVKPHTRGGQRISAYKRRYPTGVEKR